MGTIKLMLVLLISSFWVSQTCIKIEKTDFTTPNPTLDESEPEVEYKPENAKSSPAITHIAAHNITSPRVEQPGVEQNNTLKLPEIFAQQNNHETVNHTNAFSTEHVDHLPTTPAHNKNDSINKFAKLRELEQEFVNGKLSKQSYLATLNKIDSLPYNNYPIAYFNSLSPEEIADLIMNRINSRKFIKAEEIVLLAQQNVYSPDDIKEIATQHLMFSENAAAIVVKLPEFIGNELALSLAQELLEKEKTKNGKYPYISSYILDQMKQLGADDEYIIQLARENITFEELNEFMLKEWRGKFSDKEIIGMLESNFNEDSKKFHSLKSLVLLFKLKDMGAHDRFLKRIANLINLPSHDILNTIEDFKAKKISEDVMTSLIWPSNYTISLADLMQAYKLGCSETLLVDFLASHINTLDLEHPNYYNKIKNRLPDSVKKILEEKISKGTKNKN
jgi:hypothetical protein